MRYILLLFLIITPLLCQSLETGYASWYGGKFQGRYTASGEIYDMNKLTAAHKTLPFGTFVKVINIENGKSIVVKINDRGPFVEGRIIDLSRAAAEEVGMLKSGIAKVLIRIVSQKDEDELFYSIQIGSYSDPKNAERIKNLLKEKDFGVIIEKTTKGLHRVIIDNIKQDDLQPILKELTAMGFVQVLVKKK
ncbi:MAG: septal ring lytic transglycosylase RlpA family protein [Spirochaetales bacterium]|nr:septal ring lytic transglycosylase RlpA family protein [Spirochaetales bacterium]